MGARAHMSPRLLQILPSRHRVRLRRPARARLAGRGLPGRAHRRADPDHPRRRSTSSVPVSVNPVSPSSPGRERPACTRRSVRNRRTKRRATLQRRNLIAELGVAVVMKSFRFSGRAAVICSLILALGIPSVAMGFGEGRSLLLGKRNPSSNAEPRAEHRDRDHRRHHDVRHAPVQQEGRRRRRRDLRLPLEPRQRALHPRQQPQGRPRLRVRHDRQGEAAASRSAATSRRAADDQRHGRRHRPQRRQGRRQGSGRLRRRHRPHVRGRHRHGRRRDPTAAGPTTPTVARRHGRQRRLHGRRSTRTSASARSRPPRSARPATSRPASARGGQATRPDQLWQREATPTPPDAARSSFR